ncbi:MAG: carboxypeptidase regulatory-like domain-containing protein [Bacteroidota bacterium]
MKILNLTLLLVVLSLYCFAQYNVKGKVISQADTRPVSGASVFINGATIGSRTADDGTFTLSGIKPGRYDLMIAMVGFDKFSEAIEIVNSDVNLPVITIFPKTTVLNEVKIKAGDDAERRRYYETFKDEFLGKSDLAKECKILNPELLDYDYDDKAGILKASSVDFLIIENHALGYRLKYLLSSFSVTDATGAGKEFSYAGNVFFEPMRGSPRDEERWRARRQEVYEGSQLHFLRAVLNNRVDQEGFQVLRYAVTPNPQRPADSIIGKKIQLFTALATGKDKKLYKDSLKYWQKKAEMPAIIAQRLLNTPLKKPDFAKPTDQHGLYALLAGGQDALYINYDQYHHYKTGAVSHLSSADNTYATLLTFSAPAFFDSNGSVLNPQSLSYLGVWSRNRIASLLPVDYEPSAGAATTLDSALVKKIDNKVAGYTTAHPEEKVYVHFDKPYYAAGDTIYYSAYITEGAQHKPTGMSAILHAELIGPDNKISDSELLLIKDGTAWGDFALPDTLKSGNYRVRAYTQLMLNNNTPGYFEQNIAVGSTMAERIPESGAASSANPKLAKPATRFLPEGGNLVTGIRSKIAFKALAGNGMGVDVRGAVLDETGKQVTEFTSSHLGMGYFYLTPAEGKSYRARLTYADGTEDILDLPHPESSGIVMETSADNRIFNFKISGNKTYFQANKNKSFTLIAYQDTVPLSIAVKFDKQEVTATLPKKTLHTGIVKVTLFTSDGEALCERLLFVQNGDMPGLQLTAGKTSYAAREKVSLDLKTALLPGHYSVSVTDEGRIKPEGENEQTIISNLLLTSELHGYVEQPGYYFAHPGDKTAADLDLVMLTHGYRRFEWEQVLNGSPAPAAFKPEKALVISGIVKKDGKPLANAKIKLFGKGKDGLMLDTVTNAAGRFVFDNLGYSENAKFVLQARGARGDKDVDVEPDKPLGGPAVINAFLPATDDKQAVVSFYTQGNQQYRNEQKKYGINEHTQMLKEVTIKDKKIIPLEHSKNLNGPGNANQVLTAKDIEKFNCGNLADCLQGVLNGIFFIKSTIGYEAYLHKLNSISYHPRPMAYVIDGAFVSADDFSSLYIDDIEGIEVITDVHYGAIYGTRGADGVIMATTKLAHRTSGYYKDAPGVITYMPKGFYKAREFYSPQYDNPHTNQKMADLRSTIYWNPNIITDKDGKASFSYFNADGKGTYRVVIEGIDADGNLGRQVLRYKVE